MYRFRSIYHLLDGYKELQNQEIYFAPPEELNDPMEGFKDIFWHGDDIVWKNLIKHYLVCLEHSCSLYVISGEKYPIDENNIAVFKTEKHYPTTEYKKLCREIIDLFFQNRSISSYIKNIPTRSKPIRRNELFSYLRSLHLLACDTIFAVYKKYGLVPENYWNENISNKCKKVVLQNSIFSLTNAVEKEYPEMENAADLLYSISKDTYSQLDLIGRYNWVDSESKNKNFIFLEFPEKYIKQLEKLIYPDWYTACFMSKCSNSSVWGHYGNNHTGVCLKFKTNIENGKQFIKLKGVNGLYGSKSGKSRYLFGYVNYHFYKVEYEEQHIEIDFFNSLGCLPIPTVQKVWHADENGKKSRCSEGLYKDIEQWRKRYWKQFYKSVTTKLKDWKYENEYRLITTSDIDMHKKTNRKWKYDFCDLDGIIFGIKTKMEDKLRIIKIIEKKCRKDKRDDFNFYQAFYSIEKRSIDYERLRLLKFK